MHMFVHFYLAPGDFAGLQEVLTFDPNDLNKTLTITVNQDTIVEYPEEFQLSLAAPEGEMGVAIKQNTSTVTIMDNDGMKHYWWVRILCS